MHLVQQLRDMHILSSVWSNHVLWGALLSFAFAQLAKFMLDWIRGGKADYERILGSGGMPSSHSAAITGLTVGVMLEHGVGSTFFAMCVVLTVIICYDASGVRQAAGEHAKILNKIRKQISGEKEQEALADKELKELLGHTKLEVLAGVLTGLVVPMLYYSIRVM